ncbi:MAG: hypothetical protein RIS46_600, partial [Actinomycetota bacterium]
IISHDSPSSGSGNRRSVAIPHSYLPVPADAARLRVAARSLDIDQWVSTRDDDWLPTIEMKRALIDERRDEVVTCRPGAEEACEEVARGMMRSIGIAPTDARGVDALVEAALCVADDLCILIPDAEGMPRLVAAVLCSPNRWRLTEKIGGTMASIHTPVARYDKDLDSPVNAVLTRLNVEKPMWRTNWGISNHASLFQPDIPPITPEIDIAEMWFRTEWQTLRRLPETGAILFTIRTYVEKLSDFVTRDYELVHGIGDIINKIPENVAQYKSIAPYRERLFEYFSAR